MIVEVCVIGGMNEWKFFGMMLLGWMMWVCSVCLGVDVVMMGSWVWGCLVVEYVVRVVKIGVFGLV